MPPEPLPYTLCFITRGSRLLLLERRREPNLGLWNGVGGKLAAGESPRDCILREVREETGLDLTDLTDVRLAGVVTWYEDGRLRAGAYTYVATLPDDATYETPRETDEGTLDWKERAWVLDPANERIAVTARRFLATLLDEPTPYEHCFVLAGNQIVEYTLLSVDAWADLVDPRLTIGS
jgi:8-oxo-dGTP diphosphatase